MHGSCGTVLFVVVLIVLVRLAAEEEVVGHGPPMAVLIDCNGYTYLVVAKDVLNDFITA